MMGVSVLRLGVSNFWMDSAFWSGPRAQPGVLLFWG